MSGGTPVGGGYMRQRHSQGGYASSNEDLEDDACSRLQPLSAATVRTRTWTEILENVLWVVSALFIIYFGDRHSNLIYILWHDEQIRRLPLYLGLIGIGLNAVIFFYTSILAWSIRSYNEKWELLAWTVRRFNEKWELSCVSALPIVTLLGLVSFFLLCFAMWPIWGFLTIPLLFTLFMAGLVVYPHMMIETFRPQNEFFRIE